MITDEIFNLIDERKKFKYRKAERDVWGKKCIKNKDVKLSDHTGKSKRIVKKSMKTLLEKIDVAYRIIKINFQEYKPNT